MTNIYIMYADTCMHTYIHTYIHTLRYTYIIHIHEGHINTTVHIYAHNNQIHNMTELSDLDLINRTLQNINSFRILQ